MSLAIHTRAVWKGSTHFKYLQNRSRGLDVTCQPVKGFFALCDGRIHNDRASRSAPSRQRAVPFYSSRSAFYGKASHHQGLSAPLLTRFGSLRHLDFPKAKITVERDEIYECDGHTVHMFIQRRLIAD
jgi:hypothetical protein